MSMEESISKKFTKIVLDQDEFDQNDKIKKLMEENQNLRGELEKTMIEKNEWKLKAQQLEKNQQSLQQSAFAARINADTMKDELEYASTKVMALKCNVKHLEDELRELKIETRGTSSSPSADFHKPRRGRRRYRVPRTSYKNGSGWLSYSPQPITDNESNASSSQQQHNDQDLSPSHAQENEEEDELMQYLINEQERKEEEKKAAKEAKKKAAKEAKKKAEKAKRKLKKEKKKAEKARKNKLKIQQQRKLKRKKDKNLEEVKLEMDLNDNDGKGIKRQKNGDSTGKYCDCGGQIVRFETMEFEELFCDGKACVDAFKRRKNKNDDELPMRKGKQRYVYRCDKQLNHENDSYDLCQRCFYQI